MISPLSSRSGGLHPLMERVLEEKLPLGLEVGWQPSSGGRGTCVPSTTITFLSLKKPVWGGGTVQFLILLDHNFGALEPGPLQVPYGWRRRRRR